jgi:arylsulfatase/uncharacterized sulfatase
MMRTAGQAVFQAALCFFTLSVFTASLAIAQDKRPNILLVVVDDAGFMDFGAYGSDTATPNIDRLSKSGAMFTRFYATPQCGPSRSMLLTGQSSHAVGMGSIGEVMNDKMRALPAYSLKWKEDQKTIATHLKNAGYQTFASGKWGIGYIGENLPHRFGFDRSWVLDSTGASNYSTKSYLPVYEEMKWFEDGKRVSLPQDFYSSRDIVDKLINYVDKSDPSKPFFGYLSFQAIHIPLQVSPEYIDKYNGVFDRGWDVMQEERLKKAVALGLVPKSAQLPKETYNRRKWSNLSAEEKKYWARVMQTNAGMMEAADFHMGRLLNHLASLGKLDNTIVMVVSDNGPEGATLAKTSEMPTLLVEKLWTKHVGWDVRFDNLGQRESIAAIGHEWATVSAAPFNLFKFTAGEGGMRVPFVVAGPNIAPQGVQHARAQIADIAPTLLDAAGVGYAKETFHGRSLMPVLKKQTDQVYGERDAMPFEVSGTAALYRGNWKITKTPAPYGTGQWQLFDLSIDPGETKDLALAHPDLFQDMRLQYEAYAKNSGVFEFGPGESARQQLIKNNIKVLFFRYWYVVLGFLLAVAAIIYGAIRAGRSLYRRLPKKHSDASPQI